MTPDQADAMARLLIPLIEALLLTPAEPEVWAVLRPRRCRVVRLPKRQAITSAALARSKASTAPAVEAHGYDRQ